MTEFKKVYLSSVKNEDIGATRSEYLFPMPKFLEERILPCLNNPLDIIMVHLQFNFLTVVFPISLLLFKFATTSWPWWAHVLTLVLCLAQAFVFYPRYALMLHYSQHRALYKEECNFLNFINPYL
jgi:hypothetical protein